MAKGILVHNLERNVLPQRQDRRVETAILIGLRICTHTANLLRSKTSDVGKHMRYCRINPRVHRRSSPLDADELNAHYTALRHIERLRRTGRCVPRRSNVPHLRGSVLVGDRVHDQAAPAPATATATAAPRCEDDEGGSTNMSDTPCPNCGYCPTCGHRRGDITIYPSIVQPAPTVASPVPCPFSVVL